jgi:hypothetical protein
MMKTKKKEKREKKKEYVCVYIYKLHDFLDTLGIWRGFEIKTHTHLSNHVQSDNEDFVCASDHSLPFAHVCSPLSPSLKTLFSNDLFDEAR